MKFYSRVVPTSGWLLAVCLSLFSCGKALSNSGTDSATHWLRQCSSDAECGALECICGVCTKACSEPSTCPNATVARCAPTEVSSCDNSAPVCIAQCQVSADCQAVRSGLICSDGRCITPVPDPGAGGSGGASGSNCANEPGLPRDGCVPPAPDSGSGGDCSDVPACRFACPDGTVNPVDENGCTHSCECVSPGTPAGSLSLFYTCGDPLCRGYTASSSATLCSTEQAGDPCRIEGTSCDPQDDCNRQLICSASDPRLRPGGCPISRQRYKEDIHYLSEAELTRYQAELLRMRLATWRYKHDPSKQRLGFMIDDNEQSEAVDPARDMVDLYGYTSMAVAALQVQARELEALRREVAELRKAQAHPDRPRRASHR